MANYRGYSIERVGGAWCIRLRGQKVGEQGSEDEALRWVDQEIARRAAEMEAHERRAKPARRPLPRW